MVWNRRHASLYSEKAAPYFLHVTMVVAVGAYVLLGAWAIRSIEATPRVHGSEAGYATKEDRLLLARQQMLQKNLTYPRAVPSLMSNLQKRSREEEREIPRVKRKTSMLRSRHCVTVALRRLAEEAKCDKSALSKSLVKELDDCYEEDIRSLVQRAKEEAAAARSNSGASAPSKETPEEDRINDEEIEWVYWSMTDAILFCFTVITTIGYGNVAPQKVEGQLFVILYGLFGVPFTMVVIANLGKFLAEMLQTWMKPFRIVFKKLYFKLFKSRKFTSKLKDSNDNSKPVYNGSLPNGGGKHVSFQNVSDHESSLIESIDHESGASVHGVEPEQVHYGDDEDEEEEYYDEEEEDEDDEDPSTHKNAASLFICFVLYLVIGSVIIASYEPEMDVFKAIYYTFVSLTTIGLGDVVPKSESYLAFTLIYIAIGLALTTIAIEIASDYLKKLHYFGRKMENVGNVQIWFGGKRLTMNQLVKNLGDQFNLPVDELQNLNLDEFVDNAIKVEEGELPSLRNPEWPYGIKPIFITDFKDAFRDGSVIYADEDERYIIYSYAKSAYEKIIPRALPASIRPPPSPVRAKK